MATSEFEKEEEEEMNSPAAILAESSSTQRKWAPFIMLGPILPSMLAVVTIVLGETIVKDIAGVTDCMHNIGSFLAGIRRALSSYLSSYFCAKMDVIDRDGDIFCGYPIDTFVSYAVVSSYLLLLVFAWSFLGFETTFSIRGRKRRFLRPFSSLGWLAFIYFLLFLLSFAIWILGTWSIAMDMVGNVCRDTNPLLYSFALFLVGAYWMGVFFGLVALFGTLCGKGIQSRAQASMGKAANYAEDRDKAHMLRAEHQLVGSKFDELDREGTGAIDTEEAERLIEELGVGLSSKKLKKAMAILDPGGDGVVTRTDFMSWYKEHGRHGEN